MPPDPPPLQGATFGGLYLEPKPPSLKSQTLLLQGEDAPRSPLQGTTFSGLYLEPKPPSLKSCIRPSIRLQKADFNVTFDLY